MNSMIFMSFFLFFFADLSKWVRQRVKWHDNYGAFQTNLEQFIRERLLEDKENNKNNNNKNDDNNEDKNNNDKTFNNKDKYNKNTEMAGKKKRQHKRCGGFDGLFIALHIILFALSVIYYLL